MPELVLNHIEEIKIRRGKDKNGVYWLETEDGWIREIPYENITQLYLEFMYNMEEDKDRVKIIEDLPDWLLKEYKERAENERKAGVKIIVDKLHGYISIEIDEDNSYYFSGYDFDKMIHEVPNNISPESFYLAQLMNW